MARLFGTDGVRGLANKDITAEVAVDLAVATAHVAVWPELPAGRKPRAVVGNDSRASGDFLQAAISAGLASAGMDVMIAGMLPTPGLAFLTASMDVQLGVMISASHNPMADNGIKFFTHSGYKLADDVEAKVEQRMGEPWERPIGEGVGRIRVDPVAQLQYAEHLIASAPCRLDGLRVVLDCANGASSETAPEVFRALGANVVVINAAPDGANINAGCGSTHPEELQAEVVRARAAVGFAFDGDADRCLAVDATGRLVNGDQIMGILALSLKERGELKNDTLVTTVMSNLGLHLAMRDNGIDTVQTGVGDRYVLEEMIRSGYNLGGEQSGHVILSDFATTGDGTMTAIQVAAEMVQRSALLADLAARVPQLPQVLINVGGVNRDGAATDEDVAAAVASAEDELGERGRVVLRPSGTEPLVRVMVEAASHDQAQRIAEQLAAVVKERLAL